MQMIDQVGSKISALNQMGEVIGAELSGSDLELN
jgi:hypothetical protein